MTPPQPRCEPTGKAAYPTWDEADQDRTRHGLDTDQTYLCRHGGGHWHLTTQTYRPLALDRRRRTKPAHNNRRTRQ